MVVSHIQTNGDRISIATDVENIRLEIGCEVDLGIMGSRATRVSPYNARILASALVEAANEIERKHSQG